MSKGNANRLMWSAIKSALISAALIGLSGALATPVFAAAACQNYCSGPHKDYKSCMEKCIAREEYNNPREARRGVRDLCASPGHDEQSCLQERYQSRQAPAPYYQQRQQRCYYDQWGRMICP